MLDSHSAGPLASRAGAVAFQQIFTPPFATVPRPMPSDRSSIETNLGGAFGARAAPMAAARSSGDISASRRSSPMLGCSAGGATGALGSTGRGGNGRASAGLASASVSKRRVGVRPGSRGGGSARQFLESAPG
jgi:hypothetical protein